jgi:hypothetical protein
MEKEKFTEVMLDGFLSGECVVDVGEIDQLLYGDNFLGYLHEPEPSLEYITKTIKLLDLISKEVYYIDVVSSSSLSYDEIKDRVVNSEIVRDFEQKNPDVKLCFSGYL